MGSKKSEIMPNLKNRIAQPDEQMTTCDSQVQSALNNSNQF